MRVIVVICKQYLIEVIKKCEINIAFIDSSKKVC